MFSSSYVSRNKNLSLFCLFNGLNVYILTHMHACARASCQRGQLAAQCVLYIPAHSVRPALRHRAQLHLRPRNVLSSSSSSSQCSSHSSPTPSAGAAGTSGQPRPSRPAGHLVQLKPICAHLDLHKVRKLRKNT